MLKKYTLAGAMAALCAGVAVGAQAPAAGASQDPATPRPQEPRESPAMTQPATTTMTGCVYREKDVPGRTPNVAERAGILEDYILADARAAAPEASPAEPASPTAGAVGTSGMAGKMFKLEHAADDKLSSMVGKRVEVTGRIDREAGDTAARPDNAPAAPERDKNLGPDQIELPEFEVTSIREVAGTCPASPGVSK